MKFRQLPRQGEQVTNMIENSGSSHSGLIMRKNVIQQQALLQEMSTVMKYEPDE